MSNLPSGTVTLLSTKIEGSMNLTKHDSRRRVLSPSPVLFRFTLITLQVYALGGILAAEDGGLSKGFCQANCVNLNNKICASNVWLLTIHPLHL